MAHPRGACHSSPCRAPWAGTLSQVNPRNIISQKVFTKSFCKGQFPHKSVNLTFIITNIKNKSTDLSGNWLLQNDLENDECVKRPDPLGHHRKEHHSNRYPHAGIRPFHQKSTQKNISPLLGGGGTAAVLIITALEREGHNTKGVQDFSLEAKARMWP